MMRQDLTVSESVFIDADVKKVWKGLTDPDIIREYLYGTETITEWTSGSPIVFQGEYDGITYKDHGIILENIEDQKIAYSYWSGFSGLEDKPENYSTVIYEIEDKGNNQTALTWTQIGYSSEDGYNHSKNGMKDFLDTIKQVIESIK